MHKGREFQQLVLQVPGIRRQQNVQDMFNESGATNSKSAKDQAEICVKCGTQQPAS